MKLNTRIIEPGCAIIMGRRVKIPSPRRAENQAVADGITTKEKNIMQYVKEFEQLQRDAKMLPHVDLDKAMFQSDKSKTAVAHYPHEGDTPPGRKEDFDEGLALSTDELHRLLGKVKHALSRPRVCNCGCATEYQRLLKKLRELVGEEVTKVNDLTDTLKRNGITATLNDVPNLQDMKMRSQQTADSEASVAHMQDAVRQAEAAATAKRVEVKEKKHDNDETKNKVDSSEKNLAKLSELITNANQDIRDYEVDVEEGSVEKLKEKLKLLSADVQQVVEAHAVAKREFERAEMSHEKAQRKGAKLSDGIAECATVGAELSVEIHRLEKELEDKGVEMSLREADVKERMNNHLKMDGSIQKRIAKLNAFVDRGRRRQRGGRGAEDTLEDELEMVMLALKAHEMAWSEKLRFVKREIEEYDLEASLRPDAIKNLENAIKFLIAIPDKSKESPQLYRQKSRPLSKEKTKSTRFDSPTHSSHLARQASLAEPASPAYTTSTAPSSPSPTKRTRSYSPSSQHGAEIYKQKSRTSQSLMKDGFIRHPITTVAEEVDEEVQNRIHQIDVEVEASVGKDPEAPLVSGRGPRRRPRRPVPATVEIAT